MQSPTLLSTLRVASMSSDTFMPPRNIAAIGLAAVLLQLRLRNRTGVPSVRQPVWLNLIGTLLAVSALFSDLLHMRPQWTETLALAAVATFAVSGAHILHAFRMYR